MGVTVKNRLNYMMRLYILSAIVVTAMTKFFAFATATKTKDYIFAAIKAVVKARRYIFATITAAILVLGVAVTPAAAYQVLWIKDSWGGRWGTSCRPTVEYHGNGYETVRERRHPTTAGGMVQLSYCDYTGYVQTGYWTRNFPMYY